MEADQTVEISVHINAPSDLPDNARLRVAWRLVTADDPAQVPRYTAVDVPPRDPHAFGIYIEPTCDWNKLLHALDSDVYVVYRAPVSGVYELNIEPETSSVDLFSGNRWRESGTAPQSTPVPRVVEWPEGKTAEVKIEVRSLDLGSKHDPIQPGGVVVEAEPNDTPEQAQPLNLSSDSSLTFNVMGTSDDIEYFDNGEVGGSGDDWFRIAYPGAKPQLMMASLSIPDQQVVAQIRVYRLAASSEESPAADQLIPIEVYEKGKNPNERVHQQDETHRTAIGRILEPGGVYFLRVEANAPAYDLEVRLSQPAPFSDPRQAIRHALYDHIGQVDAWLTNRPRGASVERRIRDSGNLLGTNCMSCHTQSGVWGPATAAANGYRIENYQAWWHLQNTCYQSMRPTNVLKDAAVNTSLKPLDIGDGPAGTRVTGHAVVALERVIAPRKLHSKQAIRAANYVLQTGDPGGINAAGPGANVGQAVVLNYAGEILESAWRATDDPKYFRGLEEKARKMLEIKVKYVDDLGHRIEFYRRFFPENYLEAIVDVAKSEQKSASEIDSELAAAWKLREKIDNQLAEDIHRLRQTQLTDGAWSFDPGSYDEESKQWIVSDNKPDPSPTALALIGLHAADFDVDDEVVSRGIQALLSQQHPTGYWNGASKTGFVSTGYSLQALSRYFPEVPMEQSQESSVRTPQGLLDKIRSSKSLATRASSESFEELAVAAESASPLVRYWGMLGLGNLRCNEAIPHLVRGLGDSTKVVREAAHWGLRQHLVDDRGWSEVYAASTAANDHTREAALRALVMKTDAVLTQSDLDWKELNSLFDRSLNDDPHPGVRAWATRAAWQWWVWNPPIRLGLNDSWCSLLSRPENNALVENAIRYQSHALFVVNGHVANASQKHQYVEMQHLFENLYGILRDAHKNDPTLEHRLTDRLVAIASTYYKQAGGDGGPGQLGYSTKGAEVLFGKAIDWRMDHIEAMERGQDRHRESKLVLEAATNNPYEWIQDRLVEYSVDGPEDLRQLAAASISDPRLVRLVAVAEQLEPLQRQLVRGAMEPGRRKELADPLLELITSVSWVVPESDEQRTDVLKYFLPDFSRWQHLDQIDESLDAAARQVIARQADATWYLADGLGQAIQNNPDLHFRQLADAFPDQFRNGAEARFWIRSVPWILTFEQKLPAINQQEPSPNAGDPYAELRQRALTMYLEQLGPGAMSLNRKLAVELANKPVLRRNAQVLAALRELTAFESDDNLLRTARRVIECDKQRFSQLLVEAIAKEQKVDASAIELSDSFVQDVVFFRDYVTPEMSKELRGDGRSCMTCHGEPDRVPSFELYPPNDLGYLRTEHLLTNYRRMQARVNKKSVNTSKILRKPLNVQSGEEDGHQGGRRYQTMDKGYQILRSWVENQVKSTEPEFTTAP
ncbi:HEAT repeat domain-containing protein [Aeoliella straminimaris]|uniref:HEAT repeat domain-containing protein n=1 Tax=Aeoliella straminimaris TaxID=2954799 RepID=UPI0020928E46|nr:hypothetical protein [Aeoliella straminimaris]